MLLVLIQVNAIQMGTHNICFYKEVDKQYTGCNLKTTELLNCVLIGVRVVIRLNLNTTNLLNCGLTGVHVVIGSNLKTTELLNRGLIGVCVVTGSNLKTTE